MKSFRCFFMLFFALFALFIIAACSNGEGTNSADNARIVSIGPANTEIIVALGLSRNIIATDTFSENVPGIASGISQIDMMAIDIEHIISLAPSIVVATEMIRFPGAPDPLAAVEALGIEVVFIPVSDSIDGIRTDIRQLASIFDAAAAGETIIANMDAEIASITSALANVSDRRSVYFELYPPPFMTSFGQGSFLQEVFDILNIDNIFADQGAWVTVADEVVIERNPDVILTSVDMLPNMEYEIANRPGWGTISAVQDGNIFVVNADASNRPSHNIVYAIRQIAQLVYPSYFR